MEDNDVANLYKKPTWTTDRKTGRKVRRRSKKWWGKYRDASGMIRRVPLVTDKGVAQMMLNGLVRKVEREKAGLVDPSDEQRQRPLSRSVDQGSREWPTHRGHPRFRPGDDVRAGWMDWLPQG